MKDKIKKLIELELEMTRTDSYRNELNKLMSLVENCGNSFEEQMSLYRSAKNVMSDTSPRENLFLIKEEYISKMDE